jgi:hypothetical protein
MRIRILAYLFDSVSCVVSSVVVVVVLVWGVRWWDWEVMKGRCV